jgi:protein tyrosine phosphatase
MILQQKSHIIVMLTQCNERRRVKCDHYWPFTDEPVTYGEISVEMLLESESPEWTIRNFRLGYVSGSTASHDQPTTLISNFNKPNNSSCTRTTLNAEQILFGICKDKINTPHVV